MGLFTPNYTKEGPGVEKNAPQKKRFFVFFEIYFRKFWKMLQSVLFLNPARQLFIKCQVPYVLDPVCTVILSGAERKQIPAQ